jgi:hypothetical protein
MFDLRPVSPSCVPCDRQRDTTERRTVEPRADVTPSRPSDRRPSGTTVYYHLRRTDCRDRPPPSRDRSRSLHRRFGPRRGDDRYRAGRRRVSLVRSRVSDDRRRTAFLSAPARMDGGGHGARNPPGSRRRRAVRRTDARIRALHLPAAVFLRHCGGRVRYRPRVRALAPRRHRLDARVFRRDLFARSP